jgi:hypothetical protein
MSTLTREKLADFLGVTPRTIKQWTEDVIPRTCWTLAGRGQSNYEYSPRAAMIGQLMVELGDIFGSNSPLPKRITEQVVRELDRLGWPAERNVTLDLTLNGITMRVPMTFMQTAREKLAQLA